MYHTLLTTLDNGIYTITINRPDKLNAINKDVMSELGEVVREIYVNTEIKGAIITGAGPKAFVAGADISEFSGLSREEGQALAKKGQDIFLQIERSPKPIIAAVNGFALGGGCELAMACHFRLCNPTARFGQPEVSLGLIPGYGGTQRLTRIVGKGKAIELMLTARMVDAAEALQLGLVNYIIEADELLTKSREILSIIAGKGPIAVARIIQLANLAEGDTGAFGESDELDPFGGGGEDDGHVANGLLAEQQAFGECFATEDMKEGTTAFLEKRKPVFKGK